MIRQTDPLDRRICGPAVETVQRREVSNVVDDPQVVVDGRVLWQVSDAAAQCSTPGRFAEHGDGARRGDLGADDATYQRGLSASGRAEQTGDAALCYLYREVVQCWAFAANHPQVADADGRL